MRNITSVFLIFISLQAVGQSAGQKEKFTAMVNHFAKTKNFSGAVLVADKGKIIYQQNIGLADRQNNLPVTAQSKFKICSITKTFTAVIILQLMEEGKIDLNKTIGTYFPEYTGEARDKSDHTSFTYLQQWNRKCRPKQ